MASRSYMIKYIFNIQNESPIFYNITIDKNGDFRALLFKRDILFFKNKLLYTKILESLFPKITNIEPGVDYTIDVGNCILLLKDKLWDDHAEIVTFINLFDDLIFSIKKEIPTKYKKSLYKLADHLTFSKDLSKFFKGNTIKRSLIIEGMYKLQEIILENSVLLDNNLTSKGKLNSLYE